MKAELEAFCPGVPSFVLVLVVTLSRHPGGAAPWGRIGAADPIASQISWWLEPCGPELGSDGLAAPSISAGASDNTPPSVLTSGSIYY